MSAIQAAILAACGIKTQKEDETRQDFLKRCIRGINELTDDEWEHLPESAQAWYNGAGDVVDSNTAKGKNDPIPDFPDVAVEVKASTRRRAAAPAESEQASLIKPGMIVTVHKKKGDPVTGELIERTDDVVVLKVGGREKEIDAESVVSVEAFNDGKTSTGEPDPGAAEPAVGDTVKLLTKRGREVVGVIKTLDEEEIVMDAEGVPEDFPISRVESITVMKKGGSAPTAPEKPAEATSTRRARTPAAPKPDAVAEKPSVARFIKGFMASNPKASEEDVIAALKKEEIEFKDVTVGMNYKDCKAFIDILTAAGWTRKG